MFYYRKQVAQSVRNLCDARLCAYASLASLIKARQCSSFIPISGFSKMQKSKFLLMALCVTLPACSGIPYAPKGSTMYEGGYSDVKTGPNTYTVTFEGNGYNKQDQVVGFVKKRADELCQPLKAQAEVRPYIKEKTNHMALNGQLYVTGHKFPSAEAFVVCVE
ncbi:hypothetical protein [Pseudomonas yamanorum]|uniref:hypothetical protein n=1 Tax=Pseudomonas yamanorum TaxID=515393 RepID=UPI0012FD5E58|nr:hypothetical protein [Pseudomonas yamanorum]